jgi:hydrogenase maturation protease
MSGKRQESNLKRILVAGVGNRLMGDDGFGPMVIDYLSSSGTPENVELRDIGTAGLTIATDLNEYDAAIFLDSMDAEGEPGTVYQAEVEVEEGFEDMAELSKLSLHEVGLEGLLKFSKALGTLPPKVVLIGCKPKTLEPGIRLSPEVEKAVPKAAEMVLDAVAKQFRRE